MTATTTAAPKPSAARQFLLGVFTGPSQIYFQRNVVSGILILAAFCWADWRMGVLAVIGAVTGILGGLACRFSLANVASGMQSFCGTLVGAAVFAIMGADHWPSYLLAAIGGFATGPVTWLVNALFTRTGLKRFNLPYTTAPFVIVATAIALTTKSLAVADAPSTLPDAPVPAFFFSLLTNISQVVLVDNPISGALILVGLFVASWKAGVAGALGSLIGSLTAVAIGAPWEQVANGLAGYSSVLTALAVAVVFINSSSGSWLYSLPWIVVTGVVTSAMHRAGIDTYTWPYILTTWVALIVAHYLPQLKRS